MPNETIHRRPVLRIYLYLLIYLGIALLFLFKYPPRYGINACIVSGVYVICVGLGVMFFVLKGGLLARLNAHRLWALIIIAAVGLTLLMFQFDPSLIRNARFNLLNQSLRLLLEGSLPYGQPIYGHHSAFPFWFVLVAPFYLIGDIGILHILGFVFFAGILFHYDRPIAFPVILFLLASPAFLYEIAVRSGLTTNMVLAIGYLYILSKSHGKRNNVEEFAWGLLGGLIISTRGIVLIVLIIYLGYLFRRDVRSSLVLFSGWLISFTLTLVPFMLWDWRQFVAYGPFTHQFHLTTLPIWAIVAVVIIAFIIGRSCRTFRGVLESAGLLLLAGVTAAFVISVTTDGLIASIIGSHFDISYFSFPLPFLLIAWTRALTRAEVRQVPIAGA